jgi:hypothetical protein
VKKTEELISFGRAQKPRSDNADARDLAAFGRRPIYLSEHGGTGAAHGALAGWA